MINLATSYHGYTEGIKCYAEMNLLPVANHVLWLEESLASSLRTSSYKCTNYIGRFDALTKFSLYLNSGARSHAWSKQIVAQPTCTYPSYLQNQSSESYINSRPRIQNLLGALRARSRGSAGHVVSASRSARGRLPERKFRECKPGCGRDGGSKGKFCRERLLKTSWLPILPVSVGQGLAKQ